MKQSSENQIIHLELKTLTFEELSVDLLYDILQLRSEVFVVEQDCVYQDLDDWDQAALHHLLFTEEMVLLGYARSVPAEHSSKECNSIGRVIIQKDYRRRGYGRMLMLYCIDQCRFHWGVAAPIELSAQVYALSFYRALGFQPVGPEYLEDGIPHRRMIRENSDILPS